MFNPNKTKVAEEIMTGLLQADTEVLKDTLLFTRYLQAMRVSRVSRPLVGFALKCVIVLAPVVKWFPSLRK